MRAAVSIAALLLMGAAKADRQIFIPIGDKLPFRWIRLEYVSLDSKAKAYDAFATLGLTRQIEAELQLERLGDKMALGTGSLGYTLLNPVVGYFPGVSLGVRDLMNRTGFGRFGYLATTFRLGIDGEPGADTMDVTLGLGYRRGVFPFLGLGLPLSPHLKLLAEHDGRQPTAAVEFQPHPGMQIRWIAREHQTAWSLRYSFKF